MNWRVSSIRSQHGAVLEAFAWLLSEKATRLVVGFVVSLAIARHLGAAGFGTLTYATSLVAIFSVLGAMGLQDVLIRHLVGDPSASAEWMRSALRCRILGAVVAFCAAVLAGILWRYDDPQTWIIVFLVALGILFQPSDLIESWAQARRLVQPMIVAKQVALLASALVRLALVYLQMPLWVFALSVFAEYVLVAVALMIFFRRHRGSFGSAGASRSRDRVLLREGSALVTSALLVALMLQFERIYLARFSGDEAAGIYSAGVRLTEVFHALPVAAAAALLPRLTELRAGSPAQYWRFARRAIFVMTAVTLCIAASLSMGSTILMALLYGDRFVASGPVMMVHSWTLVPITIVSLRSRLMVIEDLGLCITKMTFYSFVVSIGCDLYLIPKFGPIGAAVASNIGWGFAAFVAPILFTDARRVSTCWIRGKSYSHNED